MVGLDRDGSDRRGGVTKHGRVAGSTVTWLFGHMGLPHLWVESGVISTNNKQRPPAGGPKQAVQNIQYL